MNKSILEAVEVNPYGAIRLGKDVVCDGFLHSCSTRVQSHVHADHLHDFETSKGYQEVVTSRGSYDLLIQLKNADLPYRDNFRAIEYGIPHFQGNSKLTLFPSSHILGAAQVLVELEDGLRLGYSGDFQWPLDHPINCDCLVLDSTHGSPRYKRTYQQDEVDERLTELLLKRVKTSPIIVRGHTGILQRVATLLTGQSDAPIYASDKTIREYRVYENHGYPPRNIQRVSWGARTGIETGFLMLRMHEKPPAFVDASYTRVTLSQYISHPSEPVLQFSDRDFRVAMSDHAEFEGIIDYVRAVSPKMVVTDNSRGGHAVELAQEISRRLGIHAVPSTYVASQEWGR